MRMPENIIIFGFSGSGKSTVAKALGKALALPVIHPSGILRDLLAGKKPQIAGSKCGRGFWESTKGVHAFKQRLSVQEPIDFACDELLLKEISKGGRIIDSWSLPWLTERGLRIYLKAPRGIRSERVARRSRIAPEKALKIVTMKDRETRLLYLAQRGFDIAKDCFVFDLIINTKNLTKREVVRQIQNFISRRDNKTT